MKNIAVSFLFLMYILSSALAEDSVPEIIPLRDFFRNPETTGYELSPSGASIGFLKPVDSRLNIFVKPKSGGETKQITQVKDRDIRAFSWKGDKYLLYLKDNGGDENFHLYVTQS
ncbi:MAG: S9 family peptidase, partial [Verrucomicrobia bacterium]|nr:S9 family peptidase [Verrucomicrobiota bacterium]